jgi:potassium efflux system protein
MPTPRHLPRVIALIAALLAGVPSLAAPAAGEGLGAARPAPTLEAMQRELETYRGAAADDVQGTRLKELYASAVQALRDAAIQREEQGRFERLHADSPARIERATAELQTLARARSAASHARGADIARLERLLDEHRSRLDELRARETELTGTLATLQARIDGSRQELKTLNADAATAAPAPKTGESALLTSARIDEWHARQALRSALRSRLETEMRTLPARIAAVQAQLKLATAQREQAERAVEELLGLEHLRRIAEADRQREEIAARIAVLGPVMPGVDALARQVAALAEEYVRVVTRYESESTEMASARQAYDALKSSYDGTRRQIEIAALSDALGPVLVEHYRKLAELEQPAQRHAALSGLLSDVRLREFQVSQLGQDADAVRARIEAEADATAVGDAAARRRLQSAIEDLLADRATLLEGLGRVYGQITLQIVELDDLYADQARLAQQFRVMLDRNLVWMRSHPTLGVADFLAWPRATFALVAGQDWAGFAGDLNRAVLERPLAVLLFVALALVVMQQQVRLRRTLALLALGKVGWADYRFVQALQALGIHLLLALPVPLLMVWAGWALQDAEPAVPFSRLLGQDMPNPLAKAVGSAAWTIGLLAYGYLFLREMLAPEGFARAHLRWRAARVQSVARWFRLLLWTMLPLAFFAVVLRSLAPPEQFTVARIAALAVAVVFTGIAVMIVREGRGMFDAAFFAQGYPWLARFARILVVVVLALQGAVVVLDVQGYHFTASALQLRAFLTVVVLVLTKLVIDTGLLGLAVAGRHTQAARDEETAAADGAEPEAEIDVDLEKMNASAVVLLHVIAIGLATAVLAALWNQFFIALSILDTVGLWNYEATVDGKDLQQTVSLFDLLGALTVLGLGLVLAKGLPALLGIVLYSFVTRKGVLFAIQTVLSYVVGVLGVMIALQMLGFGWSKLQWMAAGLSVGIGFGMQEIFANFFAGLIMLFERPVRIGDVVTLGEYSGTIRSIRMRATTITDFDNREIIVPNKMFVTERLINWTLSSGVVRLSFDVGVSYAADPRLVRDTLMALLAEDPRVLKDPPPNVIFREFGASSLNFRCFAHVEDVNLRFMVQNDLHMRITEVFREKGIEIAYPQMDLHLRTVDPALRGALGEEGR